MPRTRRSAGPLPKAPPPRPGRAAAQPAYTKTTLLIAGMRGNECRERIARALELVPGVVEANVNLYRARASVLHTRSCNPATLVSAIAQYGYTSDIDPRDQASTQPDD